MVEFCILLLLMMLLLIMVMPFVLIDFSSEGHHVFLFVFVDFSTEGKLGLMVFDVNFSPCNPAFMVLEFAVEGDVGL